MEDFQKLFDKLSRLKVGVSGDVMLDTYLWGVVDRISPEAPVPVVALEKKEYRIGGAGNVALNACSLGAQVFILSVTGNDGDAATLEDLLKEKGIRTDYFLKTKQRITTNKTRIISRSQQMIRIDTEMTAYLQGKDEELLIQRIDKFIKNEAPDVIIFEDYNKGVLTETVIQHTIALCKKAGIVTGVDPKRKHFFSYQEADIFKPNWKEVREGLNMIIEDVNLSTLNAIHAELKNMLNHNISFITLSNKGVFYQQGGNSMIIPSHLRSIADVSGAGDTVIAVASLVYTATKNTHLMAEIANIAGGLVCEEVGTVAIDKEKLQHECEILLS